jgi:peptide/nickel transport system ATP-binding protein
MMASPASANVLELKDLSIHLRSGDAIVEDVDLHLAPGEILGLVGESGSGKTTTALSLLGYSAPGVRIHSGQLSIAGKQLRMDESMRSDRGSTIAYVPQDPSRSLNPALRVAAAIGDILKAHGKASDDHDAVSQALSRVGLVDGQAIGKRFTHQLSGGQQQRVSIAAALSCSPNVVVLDEPTTGLDVVTQAKILDELRRLRSEHGISMVYVTHDLAVVSQIADRIAVMYAGRIVEQGPTEELLQRPKHPYTRGLLASIPDHVSPRVLEPMPGISVAVGERPQGCAFASRCPQKTELCTSSMPGLDQIADAHDVRCYHWTETPPLRSVALPAAVLAGGADRQPVLEVVGLVAEHRSAREVTVAAQDISFRVDPGECVALVGESGSGKTTIARALSGLHPVSGGQILLNGVALPSLVARRTREQRRQIQIVFQNPAAALNPRQTIADAIGRPAQLLRNMDRKALPAEVQRLLECVRLPARVAARYPRELSGGERQRVAIARALAADPALILCDEITSALDVSVQAAVLKLLTDLRKELGLSLLFITHDLGVVATVADRVMVLNKGRICDQGATTDILHSPKDDYTKRLLGAAPSISNAVSS